uniref:Putative sensor histidine-kinase response regulator n=2 Tax=termite gut metagenome TaxID=433724 RepID=S0DGC1_9ZZZZ
MEQVIMRPRILISILLIFSTLSAAGQTGKFYSPDRDLSSSLINQMYQDKRGFIWIATENGLNRFDGTKFTIYKHSSEDPTSLKNNYVRSVFEDSAGNFWIGCINGLMQYDWATNSFREIPMYRDGKVVSPHVACIMESRSGEIWLATSGGGLFIMRGEPENPGNHIAESVLTNDLNSNYLNLVYEDSKGDLWIGTENNGLNLYSPGTGGIRSFEAPAGISSNNISSVAEDDMGNIFVGTLTRGLNRYDRQTDTFRQVPYYDNTQLFVKTLHMNEQNILYLGTDGQGLKIYDRERNRVEDHEVNSAPFDFSKGKVHSILQDKDDNFWLGIFQKGVVFIPGAEKKFDYWGFKSLKNNPIGTNSVMSIFKDHRGVTWVGTDSDGIYAVNDRGECIAHFLQTASPTSVLSIYEDSRHDLWVGSYTKGLAKLNRETGACEYVPELLNEKIYSITEDDSGNLLVGTYSSGFYKMNLGNGRLTHYESTKRENDDFSTDELTNDWINDILFDSEGLIWLAHYKGVSCYDPATDSFLNYLGQNTILPRIIAYTLHEDSSGKIWIGSSEGLFVFDKTDESIGCYTTRDGLPNDVICGIREDGEGNIWISTYLGISKFEVADGKFINYYAGDGLQGNEFTRGACFQDSQGRIYFGGIYGVTCFYPADITDTKKELRVLITDFYLFNHAVREGDKSGGRDIITTPVLDANRFTISHADNTFSIEFSVLEYTNPERIVYQYMIEELGSEWINSYPGMNRVTYTDLDPGTYTFKVRARDHENFSEIKTVKITVTPPWYGSWWAYAAYTALAILFLIFLSNYILSRIRHRQDEMRRDHQEQINEAKLQFFINISHEIRTPMTLVINPLEKLLSENKNAALQKTYIMMHRNAKRILRLINQMMDIRKLDKGQMRLHFRKTDIVGFIEDLMHTFEYPAQRKNIRFDFLHADEKLNVWIDLNNFDKVLLNILSNAFKYTPDNGNITIELTTGHDETVKGPLRSYFEIAITDSGIGIDQDKTEQIFERFYQIPGEFANSNFGTGIGMHLTRSLVELHHGTVVAENRTDTSGARFITRIPLGGDHLTAQELENGEQYKEASPPAAPSASLPVSVPSAPPSAAPKPKTRYRILVAEDEDEIRDYIKAELSPWFKISEASRGKKALEQILTEMPDLIISDIMMPEMDGTELVRKVKQNININHIPIILLTAKATPESKIEGLDIGADAYISKPFNTEELRSTITNLIGNRERLRNKFSGQQQPGEMIPRIEMRSVDEIFMQRVMRFINENLSNTDLSVEMLAAGVGMSRVHLHRKLKELTNQSARDFIRGIRLKQAGTLLADKKFTISEVAYATGFSNLSHFSNSFKEFYGVSPTAFVSREP